MFILLETINLHDIFIGNMSEIPEKSANTGHHYSVHSCGTRNCHPNVYGNNRLKITVFRGRKYGVDNKSLYTGKYAARFEGEWRSVLEKTDDDVPPRLKSPLRGIYASLLVCDEL